MVPLKQFYIILECATDRYCCHNNNVMQHANNMLSNICWCWLCYVRLNNFPIRLFFEKYIYIYLHKFNK